MFKYHAICTVTIQFNDGKTGASCHMKKSSISQSIVQLMNHFCYILLNKMSNIITFFITAQWANKTTLVNVKNVDQKGETSILIRQSRLA